MDDSTQPRMNRHRGGRYALRVAYDGTDFVGWQVQPGGPSIQGELERAISPLIGKRPATRDRSGVGRVLGSGRTDAGVHAAGQIASVALPEWPASTTALRRAINSTLPLTIRVLDVWPAAADFHPIANCIDKTYRYRLQIGGEVDPFDHRTVARFRDLDPDRLAAAAAVVIGKRDFAAMQAAGAPRPTTVRTITASRWFAEAESPEGPSGQPSRNLWVYEVTADGFLYNMVRNLVGTMIEVGRGRRDVDWIEEVLAGGNRSAAGPTAVAKGLCLHRVRYPEACFDRTADDQFEPR